MTSSELVDEKQASRSATIGATDVDTGVAGPRSGPAAAVVLAAGIACFALGLLSILTAASGSVSDALTLSERVGDVSGLSVVIPVTYLVSWGVLALVWRRADPPLLRVAAVSGALIAVGLLGTFPPVFNAFGG
jgi:hypothetical protein